MIIMEPLLHLNYELDKSLILKESEEAKKERRFYTDTRYPKRLYIEWLLSLYKGKYMYKVMKDFEVKGQPKFYWLKANYTLPTHVDNGTTCSLNFLLSEDNTAVIINGKEYFYKNALLNTQQPHSVKNGNKERLLFKISIFNESFESVANKIIKKGYSV